MSVTSTKSYLIRAIHEWCVDNDFTPYIAAKIDHQIDLPSEYLKSGEITLNISQSAVSDLVISNDWVQFKARFNGVSKNLQIPIDSIIAIFAKEVNQGMTFDLNKGLTEEEDNKNEAGSPLASKSKDQENVKPGKPSLHIIK